MAVHKTAEEILPLPHFSISLLRNFVPVDEPICKTIVEGTNNQQPLAHRSPAQIAWKRFRSNPPAMGGLMFILLVALVSLLGPFIRPDSTVNANDQSLVLSRLKPGTTVQEIRIPNKSTDVSLWEEWKNGGKPKNHTSIAVDSIKIEGDSLTYWLIGNNNAGALRISIHEVMQNETGGFSFTRTFRLGTDKYGRDLLSRLMAGALISLAVGSIARGQVLGIREKEYIEAARALGFSEIRIMFNHVLPNIISPIIVISAANFASAILIEAGLSFLGLGAQIPTPSWGNMIREHYAYITTELAYLAIVPGFMIMLLVLAFMMVGNGLRDALDVRE